MTPRWPGRASRQYQAGHVYVLVPHEERSRVSHDHYHAAIAEAWKNLPDELAMEYLTPTHLRKKALIRVGHANERSIVCSSKLEARKIAAFIGGMDEYAVVIVRDSTIRVYTAKSQSYRAMGSKKDFQDSKQKVLDFVAGLIGVTADELSSNAVRAA